MKQKLCAGLCLLTLLGGSGRLLSQQITAVQFSQTATTVNLQSQRGQPISTSINTSIGSDGQAPALDSSSGGSANLTATQFAGFIAFGGGVAPTNTGILHSNNTFLQGTNRFSVVVAQNMQLPVGADATGVQFILRHAQVGAPFVSQPISFYFGSVIPVPSTDVNGTPIVNSTGYWLPQPAVYGSYTNGSSNAFFYYSPNAGAVFATQPGPISVTWVTSARYNVTNLPTGYTNQLATAGIPSFITNSDNTVSQLYTQNYLVSSSPVKTPQTIFWTEDSFANTGHPVQVPVGQITGLNVIYNSQIPASVSVPFSTSIPGVTNLNTLWYDSQHGVIRAFNKTGRVFVELVGQPTGNGTSQFLGDEIVDVQEAPVPGIVTNYLGTPLTPYQDPTLGGNLTPSPINTLGQQFYYFNGIVYYADQATVNLTDLQIYWLVTGVAGLQWPYVFNDCVLAWPSDPAQYSFYLRPEVTNQAQSALTYVQLDQEEAPSIDYQDPLDQPRAFLSSGGQFYTWLQAAFPAQRTLLRFNANGQVRFERVFSILSQALQNNTIFNQSVVTNLNAWNGTNSMLTNFVSGYNPPFVYNATVNVGDQIIAPPGEFTNGITGDYWAGYINTNLGLTFVNTNIGSSYAPLAYVNPFSNGFTAANQGAIIPVNGIPGHNHLEVWWFRPNGADNASGFQTVYWPAVVGDYTIQWPAGAPSIVLANNAGSGPLDSLHAVGTIYVQNDPTQPGYNPNEEHAVMLGGQAYALRDDLNVTTTTNGALPFGGYSSAPYVLLSYTGSDARPAMSVFQVKREDPTVGAYFDYIVTAGTQLQAPMPLPLLQLPIANGINYDTEPVGTSGDLPTGWNQNTDPTGPFSLYSSFTFQDRNHDFWVYRGLNAGLPSLQAGLYNPTNNTFTNLPDATAVLGTTFNYFIHVSRLLDSLTVGMSDLPPGLASEESTTNGLSITGIPTATGPYPVVITVTDTADGSQVTLPLMINVLNSGTVSQLGPLVIASPNMYSGQVDVYSNRPPFLAQPAQPSNCFTMRFYYKTLPGFAFPSLGNASNWPAVGTIVPYLRPLANGSYLGAPGSSNTPSLDIVYRPTWPELVNGQPLATMSLGQTLTTPINGLSAVRGQDSVQVLYQQSIATNRLPLLSGPASVVLFDPTVQKSSSLAATSGLPGSIQTDPNNGVYFFPTLPPNLINRVWFDPNTVTLNLKGQFIHDPVNGDYVMLNVLRGDDLTAVQGLCSSHDSAYAAWIQAVAKLSVAEVTFGINSNGAYVVNPSETVTRQTGQLVEVTNSDTAVDSYAMSAAGPGLGYVSYVVANDLNPRLSGDPVTVYVTRVALPLFSGSLVVANGGNGNPFSLVTTFQHTSDMAGRTSQYLYDWRVEPPVNGQPPPLGSEPNWTPLPQANPGPILDFGSSGIQGISDNYISMRYGYVYGTPTGNATNWSPWCNPILAEGWISRVTQAIDPIAGQTQNLYNNPANTTASLIELAGGRWTGNVPLNSSSITNAGLIPLYETVLDTGESLSINSGINYGPANQALLTAAGYLNDLYMTLGNAAWANSLNPTIGFGTDNQNYGAVATASFCFEGEVPTLLDQNLALLRGRDDSLSPGVNLPPAYNRLYWNYTYGLDAGQVIYALNYNITDQNGDGVVNATDAQIMFPQGHGDAYGHYLTAMMNYYKLLMNPNFDWVPQAQTVLVLGAAVTVNYENETKFASAAGALARTGRQIFDLTWREGYVSGTASGWRSFSTNYVGQYPYVDNNGQTQHVTRYWGLDHWAARVGQGTYLNWVVGNSLLPYTDSNPNDQGVQVVDRQTVPELNELPSTAAALESDMDNANAGFTPLGLSQNAIPFDINPQQVTGANPQTHFEQIYTRAVQALNNAVVAFNAAQNVTQDLRQQQNSLTDLQAAVGAQEQAYNDQLIELYGMPYPQDIGPGGTYPDGYSGPDLIHFMYVDNVATNTFGGILPDPTSTTTFTLPIQQVNSNWPNINQTSTIIVPIIGAFNVTSDNDLNFFYTNTTVTFNVGPDGFTKPAGWTEPRASVGSIQNAAMAVNTATDKYRQAWFNAQTAFQSFDQAVQSFNSQVSLQDLNANLTSQNQGFQTDISIANDVQEAVTAAHNFISQRFENALTIVNNTTPNTVIAGLADGGDFSKVLQLPFDISIVTANTVAGAVYLASSIATGATVAAFDGDIQDNNNGISSNNFTINLEQTVLSLGQQLQSVDLSLTNITQAEQALAGAQANYQTLVSQGSRIQSERQTFREHTAAQVQGYTVEDAAFLVFQNEDLERYTTLFNLAAQYAYMAAQAYDYETGLLNTPAGQSFVSQIVSSSALGVIQNGQPQVSGTDTGDPGLANALAEMDADWQVLKGRLGFNNPDGYGTIASLRTENYRILSGPSGDTQWQQLLNQSVLPDLRADSDVMNNCLQIDDGSGQAVPGIELTFSTTVSDGQNLFGQVLGPGDHSYSSTSFATKIFAVGVCFDGYVGMDNPLPGGTNSAGSANNPNALAATPYAYLIPCGADSMRSPPLGDASTIRTWNVDDVAIPLPFNIGASAFSSTPFYTTADSLSEPLFAVRKQQAFRPVSTTDAFTTSIYGATGSLQPSQFTNQRLIGRSVWNSKWKLIIPGRNLLANPQQGLARFINSVKDVHLYFVTYSYAGN